GRPQAPGRCRAKPGEQRTLDNLACLGDPGRRAISRQYEFALPAATSIPDGGVAKLESAAMVAMPVQSCQATHRGKLSAPCPRPWPRLDSASRPDSRYPALERYRLPIAGPAACVITNRWRSG